MIIGVDDREVLDVFTRLNQNSVVLSPQELLETRYPGKFAETISELASEHLRFWTANKIFSERLIARKKDSELVAQLVVAMLDGLQNGKQEVNRFYERYSDHFPMSEEVTRRFRSTIDRISFVFDNELHRTIFSRTPIFYSLFCVFVDCKYGLPRMNLGTIPITDKTKRAIFDALEEISKKTLSRTLDKDEWPFVTTSISSTNKIKRIQRHEIIWRTMYSAVEAEHNYKGVN